MGKLTALLRLPHLVQHLFVIADNHNPWRFLATCQPTQSLNERRGLFRPENGIHVGGLGVESQRKQTG